MKRSIDHFVLFKMKFEFMRNAINVYIFISFFLFCLQCALASATAQIRILIPNSTRVTNRYLNTKPENGRKTHRVDEETNMFFHRIRSSIKTKLQLNEFKSERKEKKKKLFFFFNWTDNANAFRRIGIVPQLRQT